MAAVHGDFVKLRIFNAAGTAVDVHGICGEVSDDGKSGPDEARVFWFDGNGFRQNELFPLNRLTVESAP